MKKSSAKVRSSFQKRLMKQKVILFFIISFLIIISLYLFYPKPRFKNATIEVVKTGTLTKTLLKEGKIIDNTDLALSFEESGSVRSIYNYNGQKVKAGTILAKLSSALEEANVSKAEKNLAEARKNYSKILEGASNEEVIEAQKSLNLAKKNLSNLTKEQNDLVAKSKEKLYSDSLVAIPLNETNDIFTPVISGNYSYKSGSYIVEIEPYKNSIFKYSGLEKGEGIVSSEKSQPLGTKGLKIIFSSGKPKKGKWQIDIPNPNGQNHNINLKEFLLAEKNRDNVIEEANKNITNLETELNKIKATAFQSDVDQSLANIMRAQAELDKAEIELEKKIIKSPVDGVVVKEYLNPGLNILKGDTAIILRDSSNLYAEFYVNKEDKDLLKIGQIVDIYSNNDGDKKVEQSHITSIDSNESKSIKNSYRVDVKIENLDEFEKDEIVNLKIEVIKKTNVSLIPKEAVLENGEVEVLINERKQKTLMRKITTGETGDDGLIEIKEGLNPLEKVVIRD